jgi:hypothetical protein
MNSPHLIITRASTLIINYSDVKTFIENTITNLDSKIRFNTERI